MLFAFLSAALPIFFLRIVDVSLYTMRIMMVSRGRKLLAWIFGFCQAFFFVSALRAVLGDVTEAGKVIGYATGFATGIVVGMLVEQRLAVGFTHLRIITPHLGARLVEQLRSQGYAATEIPAQGRDGMVTLVECSVLRKFASQVEKLVMDIDPQAFITAESVRQVQRGFWKRM